MDALEHQLRSIDLRDSFLGVVSENAELSETVFQDISCQSFRGFEYQETSFPKISDF